MNLIIKPLLSVVVNWLSFAVLLQVRPHVPQAVRISVIFANLAKKPVWLKSWEDFGFCPDLQNVTVCTAF